MCDNLKLIHISSIYGGNLPVRLAQLCSRGDVVASFERIQRGVKAAGGLLVISDMFRHRGVQAEAHRRKPILAAPAGRSFHEAGLAFDFSLTDLGIPYSRFERICMEAGWRTGRSWFRSEPWHVQYDYRKLGFRNLTAAIDYVANGV